MICSHCRRACKTDPCSRCRPLLKVEVVCPRCHVPRPLGIAHAKKHPKGICATCNQKQNAERRKAGILKEKAEKATEVAYNQVGGCTIYPSGKLRKQYQKGPRAPRCYHYDICKRGRDADIYGMPACLDKVLRLWPHCPGWTATGAPDLPTAAEGRNCINAQLFESASLHSSGALALEE